MKRRTTVYETAQLRYRTIGLHCTTPSSSTEYCSNRPICYNTTKVHFIFKNSANLNILTVTLTRTLGWSHKDKDKACTTSSSDQFALSKTCSTDAGEAGSR